MEKTIDVVVAGHMCVDIAPTFEATQCRKVSEVLTPGALVQVGPAKVSLGGPVVNTGLALKKFGMRIRAVAAVGDDLVGQLAMDLLKAEQAGDAVHPMAGATTSYTIALAPPGIDRMFLHCPGSNDTFTSGNVNFEAVRCSRAFHLGYPPVMKRMYEREGEELARIFGQAKQCDVTTSLDMALPDLTTEAGRAPWRTILERILPDVDVFMPSIEELALMFEPADYLELKHAHPDTDLADAFPVETYRRLATKALGMGCGMCVIKTGRRGYYLRSGSSDRLEAFGSSARPGADRWVDRELWAPAYAVEPIVSATGSGDASIAGFLTGFLRGFGPEACMQMGCGAGHFNLKGLDGLSTLPDWVALERFVQADPKQENPQLEGSGFMYDRCSGVYRGGQDREQSR